MADITFPTRLDAALKGAKTVLVLAPERALADGWPRRALKVAWRPLLEKAAKGEKAGPGGTSVSMINPGKGPRRIVLGILPDEVSRHNAPSRMEAAAVSAIAAKLDDGPSAVIACVEEPAHAQPLARAMARGLPLFERKGTPAGAKKKAAKKPTRTAFLALDTKGKPVSMTKADRAVIQRSRWAAALVDTPTAELTTAAFESAVRKAARNLAHVKVTSIVGASLLQRGLGGIHAVGRTAVVPPRLLIIEYRPPRAKRRFALVGKGVVYDTGGLSLKPPHAMAGMKCDMGGAAAAAGAALALAEGKAKEAFVCALPLAENAIGPDAYRPDDILTMHSGKTVEINNTDAEGRLLLADGVSYVTRKYKPMAVFDAATRYAAANMRVLNFLLEDSLGGGGSASLKTDAQGKTHGLALLRMELEVPQDVLDATPEGTPGATRGGGA